MATGQAWVAIGRTANNDATGDHYLEPRWRSGRATGPSRQRVRDFPHHDDAPLRGSRRAAAPARDGGAAAANVRQFPIILGPEAVLEMAQRQRERATEKAVARHARRKGRRLEKLDPL